MHSWESRGDTFVQDEPFYAHYLQSTGYPHPGADEIIATYETDWRAVAKTLVGPIPDGKRIYYQKHMAHHLLDHMDIDWVLSLTNCFLIRDPREMVLSFTKVVPNMAIDQTGLPQQRRLFDHLRTQLGFVPPVIDARDVLEDPAGILRRLCDAVEVPYLDAMLSWRPGKRESHGIWAKYWYQTVEQTTSFAPYRPRHESVPENLRELVRDCESLYNEMYQFRIQG